MFYENKIVATDKKTKTFKFNLFEKCQNSHSNDEEVDYNVAVTSYNFSFDGNSLSTGYGVRDLQMPMSTTNLDDESLIEVQGDEVRSMWSFSWLDRAGNILNYYIFYFNDKSQIVFDNLFWSRPVPLILESNYTSTPIGMSCRINGSDYMVFSASDGDVYVYGSGYNKYLPDAPKLSSCCTHDERMYALTATARRSLVYSDNQNLLEWNDRVTEHLDFSDERGNLSKVISFNDYLYIFRDFGITRLSTYSTSGKFSISHIFQSTSYIYPGSIASDGENVYFLTTEGFYSFNGNTVKRLDLDCFNRIIDKTNCNAICFEGKYYLACKVDFKDDNKIGCESSEKGYINNAILIYDINKKSVEFLRGVDVHQLLALNNEYKSKIALCFNNDNIGHIGELIHNGSIFGEQTHKIWQSAFSDYGYGDKIKKVDSFTIKANVECKVILETERDMREYNISADDKKQVIKSGISGRQLRVTIESDSEGKISNFNITMSVR